MSEPLPPEAVKGWYLLAEKVVKGVRDEAERRAWSDWAAEVQRRRQSVIRAGGAVQARSMGHFDGRSTTGSKYKKQSE